MKTKKCKLCGENKLRIEFYRLIGPKYKDTWDCRDSHCIICRGKYSANRRRDIKKVAVEYLGGKCSKCGLITNEYSIYDFHHKDFNKKDFSVSSTSKSFENIKSELDKCILLCANCHRIEHYKISI
jgi:hypothetical protein